MSSTDPCMGEHSIFPACWGIQYHLACCSDKNKAPDTLPVVAPPQWLSAQCQWPFLASWGCWLWRLSSEAGATSKAGEKLGKRGYHRVAPAMAAIGVVHKRGGRAGRHFAGVASWRRCCAHHWLDFSSWCKDWRRVTKSDRCQKRAVHTNTAFREEQAKIACKLSLNRVGTGRCPHLVGHPERTRAIAIRNRRGRVWSFLSRACASLP